MKNDYDKKIETAILGALMLYPSEALPKILAENITKEHFFVPLNQELFVFLKEWNQEGNPPDLVLIQSALEERELLKNMGGPSSLVTLMDASGQTGNLGFYLKKLQELFARRTLFESTREASEADNAEEAMRLLSDGVEASRRLLTREAPFKDAKQACVEFVAMMESQDGSGGYPGQRTGIIGLDQVTGGLRKGELWILGGETSAGKSVLALQMALEVIRENKPALLMSLELSADEVFARLVSCHREVSIGKILDTSKATKGDLKDIRNGAEFLSGKNFGISDRPSMTIDQICSYAVMFAESHPPAVVVVDYIQLIEGERSKGMSRAEEIATFSRRLKQLAKKLGCPVIAPSQLNDDGKLRESRAIGHDADVVLGIVENGILVRKNRNGPRGLTVGCELNGEHQRFE